ncbi:MAG: 50S ribosomal protein L9 [Lachnospiraceae bacterium]|nr:50S ribosomal protein L9 [Lachnospiraceae bacterium]
MKVILLEDVKSLGKKGDVVDVSDGYANNFILKKKLGLPATKENMGKLEHQKKREADDAAALLKQMQDLAAVIAGKSVKVSMKKGEGDRAFGSVSSKEIAQAAQEQYDLTLDKKKIVLPEPIKTFGTHPVSVKLHPQVTAEFFVQVTEQT